MKINNLFNALTLTVLFSTSAQAAIITHLNGDHDIVNYTSGTTSMAALGHTVNYVGTDQSLVFSSIAEAVIVEQQPYISSFDMSQVNSYLAGGGHIIQLGGSSTSRNLFDQMFGTTFGGGTYSGTQTMNTSGASYFDLFSPTQGGVLDYESSSHWFNTTNLLSTWGGVSVFNSSNTGLTSVWTRDYMGGTLTYLGYDYCCGSSGLNSRAQWNEVLDFAIENGGATAVPEPSVLSLMGLGLAGIGFTARRRKAA